MRLPETIKIGGTVFSVQAVPGLLTPEKDRKLNGHIKYDMCEILIEEALSAQHRRNTLMHELVHGICEQTGIDMDENHVDRFAYMLSAVLADNPALLEMFHDNPG